MKRSIGEKTYGVFNNFVIFLMCVIMLYPYLNQVAIALSDPNDAMKGGVTVYPRVFTLMNFFTVLSSKDVWAGLQVSILRVAAGTALSLIVTAISAYVLSKKHLPGRNAVLTFLLIPTFIGGGLIPTFILFRYLHLIDNFLVYIIPGCFSFYNMMIIREYLNTIPGSLEESALMDGANEIQVFYKIYFPLAKPVLATVALWNAVGNWNDWVTTLYFVNKKELWPLQFILMKIIRETEQIQRMISEDAMRGITNSRSYTPTPQTIQAAVLVVATLPIICLYPFLQKYFVSGIILGSVKE